jgi:hypothetical protein
VRFDAEFTQLMQTRNYAENSGFEEINITNQQLVLEGIKKNVYQKQKQKQVKIQWGIRLFVCHNAAPVFHFVPTTAV